MSATFQCPDVLRDCECLPFPVRNFSSETPDVPSFMDNFPGPTPGGGVPPTGPGYFSPGCLGICFSEISQELADECAQAQADQCSSDGVVPPGQRQQFSNTEQTCTVECPDGTTFDWTVAAGTVLSRWQADANARAYALACKKAMANRVCFLTASALASVCANEVMSVVFDVVGGTEPYTFEKIAGTIPFGTELNAQGNLFGTPAAGGYHTFTIRVSDAIGSTQVKEFTLNVVEITSATALPSATQNSPYSTTILANGYTGTPTWSLIAGSLPAGLTRSGAIISGTPTVAGDFNFTMQITDTLGAVCQKAFTLHIDTAAHPLEYWKVDEAAGNRVGSINGIDLVPFGAVGSTTGIIGNAWRWTSTAVTLESGDVAGLASAGSLSVSGWYRMDVRVGLNPHNIFSWFHSPSGNLHLWASTNQFTVQLIGAATISAVCPFVITPGTWYFFHAFYDVDTGKVTLEINLVAQGTSVASTTIDASATGSFALLSVLTDPGNDYRVDEIAVRDYLPDASELAAFYNGGAGHSWPL